MNPGIHPHYSTCTGLPMLARFGRAAMLDMSPLLGLSGHELDRP